MSENKPIEKLTVDIPEAAQMYGVAINTFKKLLRDGKIPYKKIGRRVLISRQALETFINS